MVSDIVQIVPDPSTVPRQNNTAFIRLLLLPNTLREWTVAEEHREKTALSMGGLWAFFSGIFAFLFGARLVLLLLGSRQLSAFGIIHTLFKVGSPEDTGYPYLMSDCEGEMQPGLVAFMRDHFIDFGGFRVDVDEDNADIESHSMSDLESLTKEWSEERDLEEQLIHNLAGSRR